MFWIFDQLAEKSLLPENQAASKLRELLQTNAMYINNMMLWKEANKRFKIWEE